MITQELSILINGKWETLDPPSQIVAMNFQANTLADFKSRNANYSQNISLPRSPKNDSILVLGSRVDAVSSLPYYNYPCSLFIDGLKVTPTGSVLKITTVKAQSIECQILGKTADLVEVLNAKSMETEKTDGFGMKWETSSIVPSGTLTNGVRYIWGYTNLVKNLLSSSDAGAPESYINAPDRAYPALNFGDVIKWIFKQEGYTPVIEVGVDETVVGDQEYIPALVPKVVQWDTDPLTFKATGKRDDILQKMQWVSSNSPISGMWGSIEDDQFLSYYATWSGSIKLDLHYSIRGGVVLNIIKGSSSDETSTSVVSDHAVTASGSEQYSIDMNAGEYIIIRVALTTTNQYALITATITANQTKDVEDVISVGAWYDLLNSLGFDNRGDLVKEFLQLYGLTIDVDTENKKVRMYTLGSIVAKEGSSVLDWSKKFIPGEEELTFQLSNYAQKNTIELKRDGDNGITDQVIPRVYDQNLETSKTLWTSKFLAIKNIQNGSAPKTVNIPVYEVTRSGERSTWGLSYSSPSDPVIIKTTGGLIGLPFKQGYPESIKQNTNVTLTLTTEIGFKELIRDHYSPLFTGIAFQAKVLQATFNLSPLDIELLDLSVPIWLEQYGHYFYISKINNYTSGKLTKVNLIRL